MIRLCEGSQRLQQVRRDRFSVHTVRSGERLDDRSDTVDDDASPLLVFHLLTVMKRK